MKYFFRRGNEGDLNLLGELLIKIIFQNLNVLGGVYISKCIVFKFF